MSQQQHSYVSRRIARIRQGELHLGCPDRQAILTGPELSCKGGFRACVVKEPSVTTTFEQPTRVGQENTKCFQSDKSLSAIVIFCYPRLDQMSYERALPVTVA
ncbi:hypothetical protein HBH98_162270 [Parastagonospora nodorum]|nr:hypothetical protein HBH52_182520 [Parastagonospora nodorum]KAH3994651.1 hypothetical protein HBI10_182150 [Parastagonospora nodorum]KAH4013952.1 hypothetical protein HBI13_174250 [Parastagonospora nodorum]KAH4073637.1 hypothetical protein HBH50_036350 [Parastagonospora nodorum]KAH4077412.1 hypothetical protein HBH46_241160 [Parastagonospora nodorum]